MPDVDHWPATEPTRFDTALDVLDDLRAQIATMRELCGSADNPHMWVTLKRNDGSPYTVCGKCGAAW